MEASSSYEFYKFKVHCEMRKKVEGDLRGGGR